MTAIALFLGEVLATDEVTTEDKAVYESCDLSLNGEDCIKYPFETCKMTITEDGSLVEEPVCVHKDTFPLLPAEIVPSIFLPVLLGIASVAGVGGGMVVVPIAVGMFRFSSKEAIAISTAIVFEAAIIRFVFFSAWTKHPQAPEKTEIDYNTVRVVYPLFLVGSFLGVILYIILSELWVTILIVVCLGGLSIKMIFKSREKFKAETIAMAKAEKAAALANGDFEKADDGQEMNNVKDMNAKI